MMQILATATLALGLFANTALAGGYTDADMTTTETQEIGSTTSDGSIWYSMNVCEIVQHTQCDTSLSQGGAAPPAETGGEGNYPPPPAGSQPAPTGPTSSEANYNPPPASSEPVPSEGGEQPPVSSQVPGGNGPAPTGSGGPQPVPTAVTGTNSAGESTTVSGSFVPATTNEKATATGTATGETIGQASSTGGAIVVAPAAMPAMLYGAMALFMIVM